MDPYSILRISRDASEAEIRKAYRKMAAKYHPDKGGEAWIFQQVQDAYQILTNPEAAEEASAPAPSPPAPSASASQPVSQTSDDIGQSGSQNFSSQSDPFANAMPRSTAAPRRASRPRPSKRTRPRSIKKKRSDADTKKLVIMLGSIGLVAIIAIGALAIIFSGGSPNVDDPNAIVSGPQPADNILADSDVKESENANPAIGTPGIKDPFTQALGGSDKKNGGDRESEIQFGIVQGRSYKRNSSDPESVEFDVLKQPIKNVKFVLSKNPVGKGPRIDHRGEFKWVPGKNSPEGANLFSIDVVSTIDNNPLGTLDFEVIVKHVPTVVQNEGAPNQRGQAPNEATFRGQDAPPVAGAFESPPVALSHGSVPRMADSAPKEESGLDVASNDALSGDNGEAVSDAEVEIESDFPEATPRNAIGASSIVIKPTSRVPLQPRKTPAGRSVEIGITACAPYEPGESAVVAEDSNVNRARNNLFAATVREADICCLRVFDDNGILRTANEIPDDPSTSAALSNVLSHEELDGKPLRLAIELMGDVNENLFAQCIEFASDAGFVGPNCKLQIRVLMEGDNLQGLQLVLDSLSESVRNSIQLVAVLDADSDVSESEFKSALTEAQSLGFQDVSIKFTLADSGYSPRQLYSALAMAKQLGFRTGIEEIADSGSPRQRELFMMSIREEVDAIFVREVFDNEISTKQQLSTTDREALTDSSSLVYLNVIDQLEGGLTWQQSGTKKHQISVSGNNDPTLVSTTDGLGSGSSLKFDSSRSTKLELFDGDHFDDDGGVLISTSLKFPSSIADGTTQCIVSKGSESIRSGFTLELHNPAGNSDDDCVLRFGVCPGGKFMYTEIPFSHLEKEKFCHLLASCSANMKLDIRIDGGAAISVPTNIRGGIKLNDLPIVLGARPALGGLSSDFFDGEVRMLSIIQN